MNRTDLLYIVQRCDADPAKVREELEQYFNTPEGQAEIARAPKSMIYNGHAAGISEEPTTKDLVVDLLMQEVKPWLRQQ